MKKEDIKNIKKLTGMRQQVRTAEQAAELISTITEVAEAFMDDFVVDRTEIEEKFKEIIGRRIGHCDMTLEANIKNAKKTPMSLIVFWKGGHFSLPVYEELERSLSQNIHEWSALVWEQILRQMFEEDNRDKQLFYYATEMLLCRER